MPGSVRFRLEGGEDVIHHTPVKVGQAHVEFGELSFDPVNLNEDDFSGLETPFPNMKAMYWPYSHALAKTLEELDPEIAEGMSKVGLDPEGDHLVITTVKDGADGMGDVSIIKVAFHAAMRKPKPLPNTSRSTPIMFLLLNCRKLPGEISLIQYLDLTPNKSSLMQPMLTSTWAISSEKLLFVKLPAAKAGTSLEISNPCLMMPRSGSTTT